MNSVFTVYWHDLTEPTDIITEEEEYSQMFWGSSGKKIERGNVISTVQSIKAFMWKPYTLNGPTE